MPRFNKSVFSGGEWLQAGLVPAQGAGAPGGACVSGVSAGSILWVKRVSSAVRPRFSPDGAGQTLGRVLRGRVLGWYGARARRKSLPGGNRLGPCRGWDGGRLPRAGRVGGPSRCGSLTVREVSFGGAWPGSRVRYDEGGHPVRFRLGRLGLVQSRRDYGRGDGPFGDGRRGAGPGFRPVDVVMARRRVWPQPPRPGPATRGSPGPAGGHGPTGSCAGTSPEPALAKAGGGGRFDHAPQHRGGPPRTQHIGVVNAVAARQRRGHQRQHLVSRVRPPRRIPEVEVTVNEFTQAHVLGCAMSLDSLILA